MDISVLASELTSGHPVTGAYSAVAETAAGELNAVNRTRSRDTVTGAEILNATNATEFGKLMDAQKDRWLSLCGVDSIDTANGVAKSLEADLFGAGTDTRTNLVAVRSESVSRAQELDLGFVYPGHVENARL